MDEMASLKKLKLEAEEKMLAEKLEEQQLGGNHGKDMERPGELMGK